MLKSGVSLCALLIILIAGCNSKSKDQNAGKQDAKVELVQYAKYFRIVQSDQQFILQIIQPDTKKIEKVIPLDPQRPMGRLACLSATHIGMLSVLNATDRIAAISNALYLYNPQVKTRLKEGKVMELGEEMAASVERIIASGSQVVVYSGFGQSFPHTEALEKLRILTLPNYDWREEHPLGKAEWILFFGYLIGESEKAHAVFEQIKTDYLALCEQTQSHRKKGPAVLSGHIFNDVWYAPAGDSYNAQLIADAGGKYLYATSKGTGSIEKSMEEIIRDAQRAKIWINTGVPTKKMLLQQDEKLRLLPPFQSNLIFDYSKSGNRFWEMSAIEPQWVLRDLNAIFRGDSTYKYRYYHRVQ